MKSGAYFTTHFTSKRRKPANEHRNNFSFSRKNHVVTELMLMMRKLNSETSQSCTAIWMDGWCLDGLHAVDVWMDGMDRLMDERIITSIFSPEEISNDKMWQIFSFEKVEIGQKVFKSFNIITRNASFVNQMFSLDFEWIHWSHWTRSSNTFFRFWVNSLISLNEIVKCFHWILSEFTRLIE